MTIVAACLFAAGAYAQGGLPATVIEVTLDVEVQTIRTGPYARFAQKFFGVMAPLSDKRIATVSGASLDYSVHGQPAAAQPSAFGQPAGMQVVSHTKNLTEFVKVPIDRRDFTERPLEEAAREAAATIFALRKHRIELITGNAGENVFGAGLPAALAELDRLEEEYLSLFMGKQTRQTFRHTFAVTPEKGEATHVVCRFSPTDGVLSADDLSGSPILLEMKADAPPVAPAPAKQPKGAPAPVWKDFPAQVSCRLLEGMNQLAAARIPVNQMGYSLQIPAN